MGSAPVRLTSIKYDLLAELAENAVRVVTHGDLLQQVWGRSTLAPPR